MNPSIKTHDFIHRIPSQSMTSPKQDTNLPQEKQKEALSVKDMDSEQGAGWLNFLKKHRKFLLLQGMLIAMIVASFIFW